MKPDILIVELALAMTNDELIDKMRAMKIAREGRDIRHVFCAVSGFGNDHRELWAIPAVRAMSRRLVTSGFISYLDFSTQYPPSASPDPVRGAWGALEVWMCAEGKIPTDGNVVIDAPLLTAARSAYLDSNAAADASVGFFRVLP